MTTVVALDSSPIKILHSLRGTITAARLAHPNVLHVEGRGADGGLWRLSTQDAEWLPEDLSSLTGRAIEDATIDPATGVLTCKLSEGLSLVIIPTPHEAAEDPPNWELMTSDGLVFEFGPGLRWRVAGADEPVSLP